MNKKFFGALAFGALVTASTGTFVSCTDYDDDIENLQGQINGLKDLAGRVTTLESSVAAAQSAATGAQSAADAAKAAASAAQSTADAAKAAAAAAQQAADDLKARVEALETAGGNAEEIAAAKAAAEGAQQTADAAKVAAQEAKDAAAAAQQKASDIATEVAVIKADVAALKEAINGGAGGGETTPGYDDSSLKAKLTALETRVATLIGNSVVSSIVFDGTLYMDGIESQEYFYFMYQPIKPVAKKAGPFKAWDIDTRKDANVQAFDESSEDKTKFNGYNANYLWETDAEWVGAMIRNEKVVNTVDYLVNPATAKVTLANLAMYGKDVTLVTRASSGVDYNVDVTNSVNAWKETVIEAKGHQARQITVPYTAAGAYETGIEDAEYNGNTYYNALSAGLKSPVATPGAAVFTGIDNTGKYYCHDLEENGNGGYDNGTNASDEGESNLFQLVANFQDGTAPSVESDYAMLYASPITPQAIAFTGETVDNHQVYGSQAGRAVVSGEVVTVAGCEQTATAKLHLYRSMQEAIENAPNFEVGYYKDQVDLKKYLEVHYNRYSKIKANTHKHAKWAYDEIGRYGLVWNYELVEWNHGESGVTDTYARQSQFANPTAAKNGVLIPCKINADGTTNTAATTKADYAIIGKEPIIKVTVTDSNNGGAVVLIGFVKFKIVERQGVHDMGIIHTFDYTVNCTNFVSSATFNTAWNEYQYNVLQEAVGLSYVEFNTLYKLDVNASGWAYQYKQVPGQVDQDGNPVFELAGTDNDLIQCPRKANTVGLIKEIKNVQGVGNNDNGLQWQLSPCELRDIYLNRNGEASTYVRYVRKNAAHASKDPVYVAVKVKVGYQYPTVGSISDKLDEYWYQSEVVNGTLVSKPSNKAGNDESKMDGVRANVKEPTNGQTVTDTNFDYSLSSAWTGNNITFADAVTPATTAIPYEYFYFHPANNHVKVGEYTLKVKSTAIDVDDLACTNVHSDCSTGSTPVCPANVDLGANANEAIANVYQAAHDYYSKPSDGTLYQNNVVEIYKDGIFQGNLCKLNKITGKIHYENNAAAKEILNLYSHSAAKAYVYVGVYGLNETCPQYVDPMKGYTYTVHFIRPIELNGTKEKDLKDAHDNGDKFFAFDLFGDFKDWRDVNFVPNNVWYFYYYNVKEIMVDIYNATTTLNGSNGALLRDVTNQIILEHRDNSGNNMYASANSASSFMPITYSESDWRDGSNATQSTLEALMKEKFGYIIYHNNMGNVAPFKVSIPVRIKYDWGYLRTTIVTINIDNTIGN